MRDTEGRREASIRRKAIAEARRDGLKLADIAKRYGITIGRVSQILKREQADGNT